MDKKEYERIKKVTERQEEMLVFQHFSNKDALALGSFLTDKAYQNSLELAIAIRRINGAILYQHMTDSTNLNNQNWMTRKFNTVSLMERSSLGVWAISNLSGETVSAHGLSESSYVFCGGGFPIRLATSEIVAVITVSNLPHMDDHQFIVEALSDWLGKKDVEFL